MHLVQFHFIYLFEVAVRSLYNNSHLIALFFYCIIREKQTLISPLPVIGTGRSCDLQRDFFITPNLLSSTPSSVYLLIGADEKICFLLCQLIHFQLCWASRRFQKQNNFQPTIQAAELIGPRAAKKTIMLGQLCS